MPWIVFDRDSRVDWKNTVGEPKISVINTPGEITPIEAPKLVESRTPVEASEVEIPIVVDEPAAHTDEIPAIIDVSELRIASNERVLENTARVRTAAPGSRSRAGIAFGVAAIAAMCGALYTQRGDVPVPHTSTAARTTVVIDDLPPPAPAPAPFPAEAKPADTKTTPEARGSKLGRLSVRGASASRRIYLDGKLLLGNGTRSFDVWCGAHTIAIGKKTDTRDINVPCGGSFVLDAAK